MMAIYRLDGAVDKDAAGRPRLFEDRASAEEAFKALPPWGDICYIDYFSPGRWHRWRNLAAY